MRKNRVTSMFVYSKAIRKTGTSRNNSLLKHCANENKNKTKKRWKKYNKKTMRSFSPRRLRLWRNRISVPISTRHFLILSASFFPSSNDFIMSFIFKSPDLMVIYWFSYIHLQRFRHSPKFFTCCTSLHRSIDIGGSSFLPRISFSQATE